MTERQNDRKTERQKDRKTERQKDARRQRKHRDASLPLSRAESVASLCGWVQVVVNSGIRRIVATATARRRDGWCCCPWPGSGWSAPVSSGMAARLPGPVYRGVAALRRARGVRWRRVGPACYPTICAELTATVTATAATNGKRQRPAAARNARTIRANLGYARPDKTVGDQHPFRRDCCQHCCQAAGQRPTYVDNSGISAQPMTRDGRSWTTCPLLRT